MEWLVDRRSFFLPLTFYNVLLNCPQLNSLAYMSLSLSPMLSSGIERHIDRRNGAPNRHPNARHQRKTNQPKATPTDLAEIRQKRKDNRDLYAAALAAVQQVVWDQAEALRENFGKHDTSYYFEEIIQWSHMKIFERSVSRWNAFLSLELERRNKGLNYYYFLTQILLY